MIDVVEDDRPLLGGDPARKASAHRDADALLYLLLDAERRPSDELVRLLVEQEDRGVPEDCARDGEPLALTAREP